VQALADACQRAGFRPRTDSEAREWTGRSRCGAGADAGV